MKICNSTNVTLLVSNPAVSKDLFSVFIYEIPIDKIAKAPIKCTCIMHHSFFPITIKIFLSNSNYILVSIIRQLQRSNVFENALPNCNFWLIKLVKFVIRTNFNFLLLVIATIQDIFLLFHEIIYCCYTTNYTFTFKKRYHMW